MWGGGERGIVWCATTTGGCAWAMQLHLRVCMRLLSSTEEACAAFWAVGGRHYDCEIGVATVELEAAVQRSRSKAQQGGVFPHCCPMSSHVRLPPALPLQGVQVAGLCADLAA